MDRPSQFSCPPRARSAAKISLSSGRPVARRVALRRAQINRSSKGASTLFCRSNEKLRRQPCPAEKKLRKEALTTNSRRLPKPCRKVIASPETQRRVDCQNNGARQRGTWAWGPSRCWNDNSPVKTTTLEKRNVGQGRSLRFIDAIRINLQVR